MISIWTIYRHPKDYPDKYVARLHSVNREGSSPTENIIIAPDLETLQHIMLVDMNLTRLHRYDEDDPVIVESYI